jgi:hypothetical protein
MIYNNVLDQLYIELYINYISIWYDLLIHIFNDCEFLILLIYWITNNSYVSI